MNSERDATRHGLVEFANVLGPDEIPTLDPRHTVQASSGWP